MARAITIIVVLILIGLLIWWFFGGTGVNNANIPEEGTITLQGTVVCLPHRDTSGPQTLECAYGLRDDDNNHYGLRDEADPRIDGAITDFPTGTEITVQGDFMREEDTTYATVGFIELSSITGSADTGPDNGEEVTHTDPNGIITFSVPTDYGMAVTDDQILVEAVIPPCETGFDYCLYYNGGDYENTNFESAGLRVEERTDLTDQNACLTTQPAGYSDLEVATTSSEGQAASAFTGIGDAATGAYTNGEEYRLFASSTCYQFTTRVAESQFENAPTGTEEFTEGERMSLLDQLRSIIERMTLFGTSQTIQLPG